MNIYKIGNYEFPIKIVCADCEDELPGLLTIGSVYVCPNCRGVRFRVVKP